METIAWGLLDIDAHKRTAGTRLGIADEQRYTPCGGAVHRLRPATGADLGATCALPTSPWRKRPSARA